MKNVTAERKTVTTKTSMKITIGKRAQIQTVSWKNGLNLAIVLRNAEEDKDQEQEVTKFY